MKLKKTAFFAIVGAMIPIACFAIGVCNPTQIKNDEVNFHGIKAKPFVNRYDNTDLLGEPEGKQSFLNNYSQMGLGGTSIATSSVWENYRGQPTTGKTTVAIIDSGLDIYHEDFLKPSAKDVKLNSTNIDQYSIIDPNSCYIHDPTIGDDAGAYIKNVTTQVGIKYAYDDELFDGKSYYSHGTACASCIGAAVNGVGGFGIAPNVNLLIVRCDLYFTSMDVAIRYAADNGADVINMSVGAYAESFKDGYGDYQEGYPEVATLLEDAIKYANSKDCVVVAAAGNEKTNHKSYPACNTGVVGVGALAETSGTKAAPFSNFNLKSDTKDSENNVDVMAPGVVYTANVPQAPARGVNTSKVWDSAYFETQGTSFASPLTAGAIALYRAKNPDANRDEVINALTASCSDIGTAGWDSKFGFGRVNVEELLTDPIKVTNVEVTPKTVSLIRNNDNPYPTAQLSASFLPSDATEGYKRGLWFSENEEVATVDENTGLVTAKGKGTTKIYFITDMDMIEGFATINVTGDVDFVETKETLTYNISSHKLTSNYGWKKWTSNNVSGESYIFGGNKSKMQFNNSKTSFYTFNTTALPGNITSITLKGDSNLWKVLTNTSSFGKTAGVPTGGHDAGTKTISTTGVTYEVTGNDTFFAICYQGDGAAYLNDIIINYTSLKVPAKTVSFDQSEIFLKVGETANLTATGNGTITYENSDSTVASYANGVVTALKEGTTTITAINGDARATCVVTVTANYDLKNITLSGTIPSKITFGEELDTTGIIVTANYTNNHPSQVVSATFEGLNNKQIGKQTVTVSYSENGVIKTATFDVIVTNIDAVQKETSGESVTNNTITTKDNVFESDTGSIKGDNNIVWNLHVTKTGTESTYYGWDGSNNGSQIGSGKSNCPTAITITNDDLKNNLIEKIEIKTKSENGHLSIKVGDTDFTSDGKTTVDTIKSAKTFIFTGSSKGKISINYTGLTKFVLLCSIKVTYKTSVHTWSGEEQAESFINYLKTFRTCTGDWNNRNDVKNIVEEYNALINDAKKSSKFNDAFEDHGYSVTAMQKLYEMVDQYNTSLQKGETPLSLVLSVDEQGNPDIVYNTNLEPLEYRGDLVIYIIVAGALLMAIAGVSVIIVKKKSRSK